MIFGENFMQIPIEVSARHIHLCKKDFKILFGENYKLNTKKNLSQPGQYACKEKVKLKSTKSEIDNITILGPFRNQTQVEISITDCLKLGIKSVIRESGDLLNTPGGILVGPCGEVELNSGIIVARRHIHMSPENASMLKINDKEIVKIKVNSNLRTLIFDDVLVRVNENFKLAMHIDTDEANACNFVTNSGIFGELIR